MPPTSEGCLRILFIAPTGFFADYGCHVRIRGQAHALRARGHQVLLCTYPGGRDVEGLHILRPPFWPRGREMPVGSSWIKFVLDSALAPTALVAALRYRPDIVHAFLHEGTLIGAVIAGVLRVPLVFDFQGSLTAEMLDHRFIASRSPFLNPLRRLERQINRWPDAILASSHHAVRLLNEQSGLLPDRVHALPDSVDCIRFHPIAAEERAAATALRHSLGIPAERRIVIYLGLLAEYQGTDLLLEAAAQLATDRMASDVHFLIMGFPWVERYRRRAEELGISDMVTFTGRVRYEDAPRYLSLGDVAVAPKLSATEGSGKLLNYMAMALPVVALDTAVHREYLGELGVYAAPGDARALAVALNQLLQDHSGGEQIGQKLRSRAVAAYSWTEAAARIEQVYAGLVRQQAG